MCQIEGDILWKTDMDSMSPVFLFGNDVLCLIESEIGIWLKTAREAW